MAVDWWRAETGGCSGGSLGGGAEAREVRVREWGGGRDLASRGISLVER